MYVQLPDPIYTDLGYELNLDYYLKMKHSMRECMYVFTSKSIISALVSTYQCMEFIYRMK